jgi:serine/threonine protein kinase
MPPESFNPNRGYDESFDIWSLGCVLYEMVVGEPPFECPEQMMGMQAILARSEIRMRDYFSNDFKRLLYGLLNKDPE